MRVLRAAEASAYLDGLTDDRERSSALAVHLTWLDHYSSLARNVSASSDHPLDMLLLYQAVVRTFREPSDDYSGSPATSGNMVNWDQATQRLERVDYQQNAQYARRFMSEVVRLSGDASCEQDLVFLLDLFLKCLERCPVSNILSGEVSRSSRRLADHDFW